MEGSNQVSYRDPTGWTAFAATVLLIVGFLDAFWGLAAILNDDNVLITDGNGVIIANLNAWGWVYLILGIIVIVTAFGLFSNNPTARFLAIVLVALNAVVQVVWLPAAPIWGFLIILLDVLIIYGLTVHWET